MLLDTRPPSILFEDASDDIMTPASKGRSKDGAERSESGDESSGATSEHTSKDKSSSDEDLAAMKPEIIQRKLISEVESIYSISKRHLQLLTSQQRVTLRGTGSRSDSCRSLSMSSFSKADGGKANSSQSHTPSRRRAQVQCVDDGESETEVMPKPTGKPPTKRDLNRAREVFPFMLLCITYC